MKIITLALFLSAGIAGGYAQTNNTQPGTVKPNPDQSITPNNNGTPNSGVPNSTNPNTTTPNSTLPGDSIRTPSYTPGSNSNQTPDKKKSPTNTNPTPPINPTPTDPNKEDQLMIK